MEEYVRGAEGGGGRAANSYKDSILRRTMQVSHTNSFDFDAVDQFGRLAARQPGTP